MKVVLWMAMSFNGIIAGEDGNEDFLSHENWLEFVKAVQQRGCLIWGRKTYEAVKAWDKSYLEPFQGILKIILSGNNNLKLEDGFTLAHSPREALEIVKKNGFDEVILTGGSTNNTSLAKSGLIDEVIIDVESVILGKGIQLFKPEDFILKLKYVNHKVISDSIIQFHYLVEKK